MQVLAKFTEMRDALQELAGNKEVTNDEVKQAIEQLENVTGTKLRAAIQELNNYLAGRKEVTNEEVKQAIEQLENGNGFESVNEPEQLRQAEGNKRQNIISTLILSLAPWIAAYFGMQ